MIVDFDSPQKTRFAAALGAGFVEALAGSCRSCTGQQRPLLTALSGGSDSTALALLTEQYARQRNITHRTIIVDHGLRSNSGDEARRVAARMQHFGIDAVIKSVKATAPAGGIQRWARIQRYGILTSAAREMGAVLLLAHHKADQAETVLMRLSKSSGLAGLSGMALCRYFANIPIIRPLLTWGPQELIAVCEHFGCAYENDPSNHDQRFERVRVRAELAALGAPGQDITAGLNRLSIAASAICREVDSVLEEKLELPEFFAEGYVIFSLLSLQCLPDILWRRVVGGSVLAVGGGDYLPSQVAFSRLRSRVDSGLSATLGGCLFIPNDTGALCRVLHEPGRNPPHAEISADTPVIFAGVWLLVSPVAGSVRMLADTPPPAQWEALPHALRQSFPIIETLDGRVLYPHFTVASEAVIPLDSPIATFLGLDRANGPTGKSVKGLKVTGRGKRPLSSKKDGS